MTKSKIQFNNLLGLVCNFKTMMCLLQCGRKFASGRERKHILRVVFGVGWRAIYCKFLVCVLVWVWIRVTSVIVNKRYCVEGALLIICRCAIDDPGKVEHLKALEGAEERLHLFKANLVEEGSFDSAIHGCHAVFHTASPVLLDTPVNDPQVELIEPAVKGTVNVIGACAKAGCVKRVVFTSSMVTVMFKRFAFTSDTDVTVDETWFSDPLFAQEIKGWYFLSKILAEEAAVKHAQENGIDLVVMNPGLVLGPLLQPTLNETSHCFLTLITKGDSSVVPGGMLVYVDVRDVAEAHILALENSSANGRYCLVQNVHFASQVFNILRQLYPSITFPFSPKENEGGEPSLRVCNDKAKSLGLNFISLEQSVKDTIQSLIDKDLFTFTMLQQM